MKKRLRSRVFLGCRSGQHFLDMLGVLVIVLILAFGFVMWFTLFGDINDSVQAVEELNVEGKAILDNYQNKHANVLDSSILIVFVGLMIGSFIGAYLVDVIPVLFWISIPLLIVYVFLLLIINNLWFSVMTENSFSSSINSFPLTSFLMDNLLWIMIPFFVFTAVLYYNKRGVG